ncbi:LacI family transcriptional regulator [Miniimonas arenae]|uniref:LacI family transcriptional regulator n=1 Tax=Miniimonas arenae TaxID=676201 RepID=A0A5C5BDS4_9MICO|nr:LacI family transcriptional regulator [Miniimonas arenae]
MPVRPRPSVADVARIARVSVGTVSNVLNRPERVSEGTRERVLAAIEELDFVPSASARQLRAGVAQTVGAIVLDVGNPFFTLIARGIEDRLEADGLALLVSSSDDDPARETRFLNLYEQHGVRGVLVTPCGPDLSDFEALRERGTHVVLMDADADSSFPSVSVDDVHGGSLAVGHLVARGHERIAFVNGPASIRQCVDRLLGARAALADAGRSPKDLLEVPITSLNVESGDDAALRILAMPEDERPTGIFCVNDLVALGVLRTLLRRGVRVPQDIAVVGYDDISFAGMLMVPLTTIRQPIHEIGWAAADLLLRQDDRASGPEHVQFTPELVVRMSSDPDATP